MDLPTSGQIYKHKASGALWTVIGAMPGSIMLNHRTEAATRLVTEETLAEEFEIQTPEDVFTVEAGFRCQACGNEIDGYESGYRRCCENCENE